MTRNDNYWGTPPGVERIFLQHMPESATQRLALEKGDIDIANKLGPDDIGAIAGNADIQVLEGISSTIYYFGLNVRNEALSNPKVVEAIKYLVDYQGIADTIGKGTIKVHQTMIPDGFLGGDIDYNPYSLDIEKAKALIAESGVAHADHARDRGVERSRPIPTMPRPCRPPWRRPASTSTCRSSTAARGSIATARTISTSGSASGVRTIPIRTRTPRPSPSTIRAIRTAPRATSPTASAGTRASSPTWSIAAVQEQDIEKRKEMYDEIQRLHTDTLAVRLHVPGQPQGCHALERQGRGARHHLLRRPLRRRDEGIIELTGPGLQLRLVPPCPHRHPRARRGSPSRIRTSSRRSAIPACAGSVDGKVELLGVELLDTPPTAARAASISAPGC